MKMDSRRTVDKRELRMRRSSYGPVQWNLALPPPETCAKFPLWNTVLIAILAFLVLGAFVAAKAPHAVNGVSDEPKISMKNSEGPVIGDNAKSKDGVQTRIRSPRQSGPVDKGAKRDLRPS